MAWTSLTFAYNSLLTSTKMTQMQDNFTAVANGDSGAPELQSAAYASGSVDQTAIGSGAVHQSELDTSTGTVSTTSTSAVNLTLAGGQYGFYPQVRVVGNEEADARVCENVTSSSFATIISLRVVVVTAVNDGTEARQRYINSSPPINMGDGDVPLFVFAHYVNGEIISTYAADVPPWLYNGPTDVTPTSVVRAKDGGIVKTKVVSRMVEGEPVREVIPVDNALKNADMNIIPHPFRSAADSDTIVLLDPCETLQLLEMHNAGDNITDIIRNQLIIDNTPLVRSCPDGVQAAAFRWKTNTI